MIVEIIPIVLLTLVENSLKQGNLVDQENAALIELITTNESLIFQTRNLIANALPLKKDCTDPKV